MQYPELLVKPNDKMQLEFMPANEGRRYAVAVVGLRHGESVLVTAPSRNHKPMIVTEGQLFNARMLVGKDVIGFQTNLLKLNLTPFPYLHLSYPRELQRLTIRGALRVDTEEMVMVSPLSETATRRFTAIPALLVDLSNSGGRLSSNEPLGEKGSEVRLSFGLTISGERHPLNVQAIIRNQVDNPKPESTMRKYFTGVEFNELRQAQRVLLTAFLNEQVMVGYGGQAVQAAG